MFHLHRWSKWVPTEHYMDTSWSRRDDPGIASTMVVRTCRCGLAKSRGLYGVVLPLPPAKATGDTPSESGKV